MRKEAADIKDKLKEESTRVKKGYKGGQDMK